MSLSVDSAAGFSPYTGWMLKGISRIKRELNACFQTCEKNLFNGLVQRGNGTPLSLPLFLLHQLLNRTGVFAIEQQGDGFGDVHPHTPQNIRPQWRVQY